VLDGVVATFGILPHCIYLQACYTSTDSVLRSTAIRATGLKMTFAVPLTFMQLQTVNGIWRTPACFLRVRLLQPFIPAAGYGLRHGSCRWLPFRCLVRFYHTTDSPLFPWALTSACWATTPVRGTAVCRRTALSAPSHGLEHLRIHRQVQRYAPGDTRRLYRITRFHSCH